jgi:hypothetical protein
LALQAPIDDDCLLGRTSMSRLNVSLTFSRIALTLCALGGMLNAGMTQPRCASVYRHVLDRGGIPTPVAQLAQETSDDPVKRLGGETLGCIQEPSGAEYLSVATYGVRNPVGVNEDSVARLEHQ